MKEGSDNFRSSAVKDIIELVSKNIQEIIIYEPSYDNESLYDIKIENDLNIFKTKSDLILANRLSNDIKDVIYKVFTRDVFNEN